MKGRFANRPYFSSATLADFIYRWRLPATAVIILGAILSVPRADITHIDNDITAWFSKEDPVYKDYERFRNEFGGTRSLIVALEGRQQRQAVLAGDAEVHPAGQRRHRAHRHRQSRRQPRERNDRTGITRPAKAGLYRDCSGTRR